MLRLPLEPPWPLSTPMLARQEQWPPLKSRTNYGDRRCLSTPLMLSPGTHKCQGVAEKPWIDETRKCSPSKTFQVHYLVSSSSTKEKKVEHFRRFFHL